MTNFVKRRETEIYIINSENVGIPKIISIKEHLYSRFLQHL